jgi:hypothetical protein
MIRFFTGLIILLGVAGNDCNGKCDPSMDTISMVIWSVIGVGLMLWSLPKLIRR